MATQNKRMALVCAGAVCNVLLAAAAQAQDVSFEEAQNFAVLLHPISVAVGDFNGDGVQDLAVANYDSHSVSVLLGNGDGSFQAAQNFSSGLYPYSVAVGDFNGDGVQDLAVAYYGRVNPFNPGGVSVLLGNGNGTFQAARSFAAGTHPRFVAIGDFNGDGVQDLSVANQNSNNISVLLGNGDGTFQGAANFGVGIVPSSIGVGDFNGDGVQDLAVAYQGVSPTFVSGVSVLLSNGDGTFQVAQNVEAGSRCNSVAVGDFNDDGVLDLAVANSASNNVSVLLGNGDGSFQAAQNFAVGLYPRSVAVGDFNGDGQSDLAVANDDSNNLSVLINNTPR